MISAEDKFVDDLLAPKKNKVFLGIDRTKENPLLCWWDSITEKVVGTDPTKEFEEIIEIQISDRDLERLQKTAEWLLENDDDGSALLSVTIPAMVLTALKRAGKL